MTPAETVQIMAVLEAAYPGFYAKSSLEDKKAATMLWATVFDKEPGEIVRAAVLSLIKNRTNTFPPVPGEVTEEIRKLTEQGGTTEMEAWNLVYKAICNSNWSSQEEFDKLPPVCRKIVGSPNQLREWALMPSDEVQTVVASNVQRSYRVESKRQQELQSLPGEVQKFLALNTGQVCKLLE